MEESSTCRENAGFVWESNDIQHGKETSTENPDDVRPSTRKEQTGNNADDVTNNADDVTNPSGELQDGPTKEANPSRADSANWLSLLTFWYWYH